MLLCSMVTIFRSFSTHMFTTSIAVTESQNYSVFIDKVHTNISQKQINVPKQRKKNQFNVI